LQNFLQMNQENQNIEWKESWRDEQLKTICGFANAQGGSLFVGKNDHGEIVGLKDVARLLEEIPNKVRDVLGILVNIYQHRSETFDFLQIEVESYAHPISYKGQYYRRSGSTNQLLQGVALDQFILRKQGKRWDGVPMPQVKQNDLSAQALQIFRKRALKSGRIETNLDGESDIHLLEKLHLFEGIYLNRACILLFHPIPEQFVTGAFIKIGFFRSDTELVYQDVVTGNLFEQVDRTMDLLLTKYLRAYISYEGVQRFDTFPIPETALREALLNAIAHKDYASGAPIQIKVYENKLSIWNTGKLPESWTIETLLRNHHSAPYNPSVALVFFRAGLIESWGSGTLRIIADCVAAKVPKPTFQTDAVGFEIVFELIAPELNISDLSSKILYYIGKDATINVTQLALLLEVSERTVKKYIKKLKDEQLIIRKGGDKNGIWVIQFLKVT
jgi:ATP-dependent DNA helicase RecG